MFAIEERHLNSCGQMPVYKTKCLNMNLAPKTVNDGALLTVSALEHAPAGLGRAADVAENLQRSSCAKCLHVQVIRRQKESHAHTQLRFPVLSARATQKNSLAKTAQAYLASRLETTSQDRRGLQAQRHASQLRSCAGRGLQKFNGQGQGQGPRRI